MTAEIQGRSDAEVSLPRPVYCAQVFDYRKRLILITENNLLYSKPSDLNVKLLQWNVKLSRHLGGQESGPRSKHFKCKGFPTVEF